jgi:hypothetical protein
MVLNSSNAMTKRFAVDTIAKWHKKKATALALYAA